MSTVGVSNVSRSEYGTRYTLTYDDVSNGYFKAGYVEVVNGVKNVRDAHDEPVRVGSALYDKLVAAVKAYTTWAEGR